MKKVVIAVIVIIVLVAAGAACFWYYSENTKKTDDETTAVETVQDETTAQVTQAPETKAATTAAPTTKKVKPKKTGGSIVGVWNWEGGVFAYVFKKDGSGEYKTGSESMPFTYSTKNGVVTIKYKDMGTTSKYKYRVEGNKFIIKDDNGDDVTYIKK